ncbi:DUF4251 domain-containing protein [Muricauda sp. JGD-17]|uniref:DUF4251 domain-containing protein n=1 Tax=Flagellimonas ochracea TaxID=2696472 RepID=A0A964TB49_9FLAO|nr:DUF4251 domain-containing protein [Allomuricauda ochracea]NAY90906.1 DUF4251 domain-containing protein [Allomuricauda ochracea]
MKFVLSLILGLSILVGVGCASHSKNMATPEQVEALNKLLEQRFFVITADWARPLPTQSMNAIANAGLLPFNSTLNRIDLADSESYLRIAGDSAIARFPYFGEQQMPGIYNPKDAGIEFKGVPTDFKMTANERQGGYNMSFEINDGTENFEVTAIILPSNYSTVSIVSTHRRLIQYFGKISADTNE